MRWDSRICPVGHDSGIVDDHYPDADRCDCRRLAYSRLLLLFSVERFLVPISEVGSLAGALGWLATCLAFCWGAGGGVNTGPPSWDCAAPWSVRVLVLIAVSGFGLYHLLALAGWGCAGMGVVGPTASSSERIPNPSLSSVLESERQPTCSAFPGDQRQKLVTHLGRKVCGDLL